VTPNDCLRRQTSLILLLLGNRCVNRPTIQGQNQNTKSGAMEDYCDNFVHVNGKSSQKILKVFGFVEFLGE